MWTPSILPKAAVPKDLLSTYELIVSYEQDKDY